jgi:imidazolonepropionase-like amidohydrolase
VTSFLLRGANVLDEAGGFSGPLDIHVVDGLVEAVGRNLRSPAEDEHDFSDLWLMPGVFDCHTHITASATSEAELLRTPMSQQVLETVQNLRRTLEGGVTFIRDAAGADAGIRDSVAAGFIGGPEMQVCINILSQTGGHGDRYLEGPGFDWDLVLQWPGRPSNLVDGVDEMRRVVRQLIRAGANWIKVCTSGGIVGTAREAGDLPEFSPEELQVCVSEARKKRRGIMCHAHGGDGLTWAIEAGVTSIEHGLLLTEEQAAAMAAADCWFVPTLMTINELVRWAEGEPETRLVMPEHTRAKVLEVKPLLGRAIRIAKDAGVRMAVGSDCISRTQHGRNLEELTLMHEAGLTVEETLLAATIHSAELCGVDDRYGRIAPGYVFDAIVFDHDLGDLSCFRDPYPVTGVFKNGVPVVPHKRLNS